MASATELEQKVGGREQTGLEGMNVSALGPFVDYYPDETGGFHLQGFVGYAQVAFETQSAGRSKESQQPDGLALAGAAGYDFWVGDQWSLGLLFRVLYAPLSVDQDPDDPNNDETDKHRVVAPALMFRGLLH